MLTSYQPSLDSSFSNPVVFVSCPLTTTSTSSVSPPPTPPLVDCDHHTDHHRVCFQLAPALPSYQSQYQVQETEGQQWLRGCSSAPVVQADQLSAGHFFWWPDTHHRNPDRHHLKGGCCTSETKRTQPCRQEKETMEVVQPEDDLKRLVENDLKLRLSGYYYGSLGWVEASEMLKKCEVGTFLVRDSEHASYLYSLSVQTIRGPTSCRVDYRDGRFRLDSSESLAHQMPRFDTTTDLIEHYVRLTRNYHRNHHKAPSPVWLDLADDHSDGNKQDVPVQMYRPLYRATRSLQHLCRVKIVQMLRENRPHSPLDRTIDEQQYQVLPTVLKDYLKEYPYSQ